MLDMLSPGICPTAASSSVRKLLKTMLPRMLCHELQFVGVGHEGPTLTESHAALMSLPSGAGSMFNLPAEMLSFTPAAQVVPPACRLPGEQGQAAAAPFLHLCQSALVALLHTSCSECSARLQAFGRTVPELLLLPPVWDA